MRKYTLPMWQQPASSCD